MKYQALAPLYDRIMSHVQYSLWEDLIDKVIRRYLPRKKISCFEIGGGTGRLGSLLIEKGFNYVGSDLSFSMCKESIKRNLPFCCADGRKLPILDTSVDLLLFLYDGINYLTTLKDYTKVFNEAHRTLRPKGIFLFDITTETNSLRHFSDFLDFEDFGDSSYVRHSYYDERDCIQHNDFTIYSRTAKSPNLYQKFIEEHKQKVLPPRLIEEAIPRDLFSIIGIWDGYVMKHFNHNSERIHFCLQKI